MIDTPVDTLICSRKSIRAYLPESIPQELIEKLLLLARQAPSGANLQPGEFHVLTGSALNHLVKQLTHAAQTQQPVVAEYSYFPTPLSTALKEKQRSAGYTLYEALGIGRRDVKARREQFMRNYRFFDAPVGIVVCIQRDMGKGCFMDLGMALMNLFLAAESIGLGATGIGAIANYANVAHQTLGLHSSQMVVCGIALGKPDNEHPVNTVKTSRAPLSEYAHFHGFDS